MASGKYSSSETGHTFMPGQLGLIGLGSREWAEQMRDWKPFGSMEDILGKELSPYSQRAMGQLTGLAAMGGYTPEERLAGSTLTGYLTGPEYFSPSEMMRVSLEGVGAARKKAEEQFTEAQRQLSNRYAARGKFGSGGHLRSLSDLYAGFGESMANLEAGATQRALQTARGGSLAESQGRQRMADLATTMFGAPAQATRLSQIASLGALPRELGVEELNRMYGLHQSQLRELLGMLGRGVGVGTVSLPMEGETSGWSAGLQYSPSYGPSGQSPMGYGGMGSQAMYNPYTGAISYPTYSGLGGAGWGGSYGMGLDYSGYGF